MASDTIGAYRVEFVRIGGVRPMNLSPERRTFNAARDAKKIREWITPI